MNENKTHPVEIEESQLDDVNGGLLPAVHPTEISAGPGGGPHALLLPAVQKVREAASRIK